MAQGAIKLDYDPKNDVLYLSFGEPREAISAERDDGLIIRTDPVTDKVIGITVVDFQKHFAGDAAKVLSVDLEGSSQTDTL